VTSLRRPASSRARWRVRQGGEHLGDVGGRIVAEVLIGLLAGDPSSYLRTQPTWKPDGGIPAFQPGKFTLGDLLKFATP
jgi:hypothetical protein